MRSAIWRIYQCGEVNHVCMVLQVMMDNRLLSQLFICWFWFSLDFHFAFTCWFQFSTLDTTISDYVAVTDAINKRKGGYKECVMSFWLKMKILYLVVWRCPQCPQWCLHKIRTTTYLVINLLFDVLLFLYCN